LGIDENFLNSQYFNPKTYDFSKPDQKTQLHIKFFTSLILDKLIEDESINETCKFFDIEDERGKIQNLQIRSSSFCSQITVFCQKLNWNNLSAIFSQLKGRLLFGCRLEILPLLEIENMQNFRARELYKNGLRTVEDISNTNPKKIANILIKLLPYKENEDREEIYKIEEIISKKIIKSAKEIIKMKVPPERDTQSPMIKKLLKSPIKSLTQNLIQIQPPKLEINVQNEKKETKKRKNEKESKKETKKSKVENRLNFEIINVNNIEEMKNFFEIIKNSYDNFSFNINEIKINEKKDSGNKIKYNMMGISIFLDLQKLSSSNEENKNEKSEENKKKCYYLDFENEKSEKLELIKDFFKTNIKKISFDIKTQLRILIDENIIFSNQLYDPRVADWMLYGKDTKNEIEIDSLLRNHDLNDIIIGSPNNKIEESCKKACQSSILMKYFYPKLISNDLYSLFVKIEMKLIPLLARMEYDGIGFNVKECMKNSKKLEDLISSLEEQIEKILGFKTNLRSTKEVEILLFEKLKLNPVTKTKNNKNSTDKNTLEQLKDKHQIIPLLLQHRSMRAMLEKFIIPLPTHPKFDPDLKMERIYYKLLQTTCSTGRLAITGTQIQNS
jgi:hypothetical protein